MVTLEKPTGTKKSASADRCFCMQRLKVLKPTTFIQGPRIGDYVTATRSA